MSICNDCLHNGCCCDFYGANCNGFEDKSKYVKVVRCKECKNISPSVTPMRETVWCREYRAYMPCDGFCSYGERRGSDV